MKPVWLIVNCLNKNQGQKIAKQLLKERQIACYDLLLEKQTGYFWPPLSGKIESGKGVMLIGVTLENHYKAVEKIVRQLHSDEIPFIGLLKIDRVNPDYLKWLKNELK